jgi:D-serine deaminase-like pyridoxal phosphate-dependent protein
LLAHAHRVLAARRELSTQRITLCLAALTRLSHGACAGLPQLRHLAAEVLHLCTRRRHIRVSSLSTRHGRLEIGLHAAQLRFSQHLGATASGSCSVLALFPSLHSEPV